MIYCIFGHIITYGRVGNMRDLRFNCVLLRVGWVSMVLFATIIVVTKNKNIVVIRILFKGILVIETRQNLHETLFLCCVRKWNHDL